MSRSPLWRRLKLIYASVVAVILLWALANSWSTLQQWQLYDLLPRATASILGWVGMLLLLGRGWAGALKAWSGLSLTLKQWTSMQAIAWMGRYLPGKIGLIVGKMHACELGANWKQVSGSVISEQLAFVSTGLALSTMAVPQILPLLPGFVSEHQLLLIIALLTPLTLLVCLSFYAAARYLPHARKTWGLNLVIWSALAHFAAGIGFHILLSGSLKTPLSPQATVGLLAAAHTAGTLAFFAPAGLGVRETAIAAALAPQIGWQQALAITALQRALAIIGDLGVGAVVLINRYRHIFTRTIAPSERNKHH